MRIRILGPLHAETDGVPVVPSAAKTRQVLALLALHPGRPVPVAVLKEELWGPLPPCSAHSTLQTYILRLRRALAAALGGPYGSEGTAGAGGAAEPTGTAAGKAGANGPARARDLLATGHDGYLLRIADEDVDAFAFQRAAQAGHTAFADGDSARAARLLREALALWKGPALVDVRAGAALRIHAARLEESRLLATERRLDAELRLGLHGELLAELVELTRLHPANERLHAQAMVAFYRAGRQSEALQLYRGLRRRLVEELGLEPAPQLQRLHQAMLSVDPRLDAPAHGGRPTPTFDLYAA
ncbi:DNA-binding SARP family transcriptional activator [Streptomyces sp. PvR006]|uniref:AfsR/SARP family transcriptional regulator n=1 Tax=unclassified Streptomyces TaxID=2593676 RepID=UPI001AE0FCE2|nr:AfsR/SARP family transcriptional regulator [Streptomyces sp. PvR006]MBP2585347.1 DNA-binding SARP family transcriptional activator [Streptomyces sp. PvR006]